MAKTVEDTAIVLQTIAEYDPQDPVSIPGVRSDHLLELGEEIHGVRIGVPSEFFWENSTEEVESIVRSAIDVLQGLGGKLIPVSLPHISDAYGVLSIITHVESTVSFPQVFPRWRLDNIDEDVQNYLSRGQDYSIADYFEAKRGEAIVKQDLARAMQSADVIVTPTCPTPALLISESTGTSRVRGRDVSSRFLKVMYTAFASVAGLPALSLPCGFTRSGLPVGLQIVGRRQEDTLVLRVGYAYEQATKWHHSYPDETGWTVNIRDSVPI
jgi:aspartyl-tRNA(Asn)/glutamyl-tRNA(Gln) amidotransferase subunit A